MEKGEVNKRQTKRKAKQKKKLKDPTKTGGGMKAELERSIKELEAKLAESEGAIGLVFSGKVTDRIFTLASGAGIENVMGTSVGTVTRKAGVQAYSSSNL